MQKCTPVSIQIMKKDGEFDTIVLNSEYLNKYYKSTKNTSESQITKYMYAKERFNISNEAYHELSIINKALPRSYLLKNKSRELNKSFNIKPIGRGIEGFQQSVKEVLEYVLLAHSLETQTLETIKIKLSGDGTWLGNRLHVITFTFTLPDFQNAKAASGKFLLAAFKTKECYDSLKIALQDIILETREMKTISIKVKLYPLQY